MTDIECPRLRLVSLGLDVLRLLSDGDTAAAQAMLPFAITQQWVEVVPAWRRVAQIEADASVQPWLARAMVVKDENRVVGYIGCHDRPDELGRIELGYQVMVADRRKGYAREAIEGLLAWAGDLGATGLILSISPNNVASLQLAHDLGLTQSGEQMDEIDGLELVFERSLPLGSPSG